MRVAPLMTWVLPRHKLPKNSLTNEQLLAAFWLDGDPDPNSKRTILEKLTTFVKARQFKISDASIDKAVEHLDGDLINQDIEGWVTLVSFMAHPHAIWNLMLDAVALAKTDSQLSRIACGLAEPLLAHYGSLMPLFERRARKDPKFACMLTGAWRHRMSDDVWARLRVLQAEVARPLPAMIPLDQGVEHMNEYISAEDRMTADKGIYIQDTQGNWSKARLA